MSKNPFSFRLPANQLSARSKRASGTVHGDGPAWRNQHPWRKRLAVTAGLLASFLTAASHAGDLLRGGATFGQRNGAAAPQPGSAAATAAKANAADVLSRTTQAMQAVQAMQQSANNMAKGSNNAGINPVGGGILPNVPNGLATGGLQVAPGAVPGSALWQGAKLPVQSQSGGQTTVVVNQTAQQAILTWQTFNVGKNTTLQFDQDLGGSQTSQWIAFNKVVDPSGVPSQILGQIRANGQVYVINRNGIIFGGASQVNTHTLVASSLPINDSLISTGLLNLTLTNPNLSFLFSSATDTGPVIVEPGAVLTAPASAANVGGRVALVGTNVTNNGTISTPDGQTILAAGLQVGFLAHPSADPSLRGLDVYVGKEDAGSGTATNNGLIQAHEASTIIAGKTVNQNGIIDSGTSVTLNGRVDLQADYNAIPNPNYSSTNSTAGPAFWPGATGTVTLGPGSVTQILPELADTSTVAGIQLSLPSLVNIQGQVVHFANNAILLAPGAMLPNATGDIIPVSNYSLDLKNNFNLTAGITISAGKWVSSGSGNGFIEQFAFTGSQIYMDRGSMINVAGTTDVAVPVGQNILSLQLRGGELADSPVQQAGILRGTGLNVDIRNTGVFNGVAWIGTPLGNVFGFVNLIQRTVAQLTTAGGTVTLNAGNSVVMQSGSTINVSGGYVNFQGGMVQTTRVMSGGQIYDISQATPDRVYDGIYTGRFTTFHDAWGVAEQFTNPLALTGAHYEQSYVDGAAGGSITISAPSVALDGTLLGNTVTGPHQENNAPAGSALALNFQGQNATTLALVSPTPPNIIFAAESSLPPANAFALDATGTPLALNASRRNEVVLSPDLVTEDGFATINIFNGDGNITVPANVQLKTAAGGSITFAAANIDIEGQVITPAGSQSYTTYNFSPNPTSATKDKAPPNAGRGLFTLGPNAVLSAAGQVIDDREGVSGAHLEPLVANSISLTASDFIPAAPGAVTPVSVSTTNGGSVGIQSFFTNLTAGSTIDVSGGVVFSGTGKRSYGNGGSIAIQAGQDPGNTSLLGGSLTLGATLKGFAGGTGGSLNILAPLVQIGGTSAPAGALLLSPDFFSQGGFTNYTISGIGALGPNGSVIPAVKIAADTVITPVAESYIATSYGGPNGTPALQTVLEPEGIRSPVSLSFNATGFVDNLAATPVLLFRGDVVMEAGSVIRTDPQTNSAGGVRINGQNIFNISYNSQQTATILGSIIAPGGTISISGSSSSTGITAKGVTSALATVYLGPNAYLSTAGTTVLIPNHQGYLGGFILPGGSISISGNIVADAGAKLDVSGTSGILDLPIADSGASNPLIGALSGVAIETPTKGTGFAFRGSILSLLPGSTTSNTGLNGSFSGAAMMPTRIDSNGGSISLSGGEILLSNATLLGAAGGPAALGGTLSISSGKFVAGGAVQTPLDPTLLVTQSGSSVPQAVHTSPGSVVGNPILGGNGVVIPGMGYFGANTFQDGGFDSLTLQGTVKFSGPVDITARNTLTIGSAGVILADAPVHLTAPHVILGQPFQTPQQGSEANTPFSAGGGAFYFSPSFGPGSLTITAGLIDVGNLSLQNIGQLNLIADNGDIRGDGTLDVSGGVYIRAGQVYPASAVNFTISVYDRNVLVAASTKGGKTVTLASSALPPGFGVGSPLLGSTVQSIKGATVTLVAGADETITSGGDVAPTAVTFAPDSGSITIAGSGQRALPLSAAGTLDLYASNITQGGVLRAPLGSINIGWDGTGTTPTDIITGAGVKDNSGALIAPTSTVATAQKIVLGAGSVTSVSAIDPVSGQPVLIPYGFNIDGTEWISPTGVNLVSAGVPGKSISISGLNVSDLAGSTIDVRGGGDLFAYQFVPGNGGSTDILGAAATTWNPAVTYAAGALVISNGQTWTARVANTNITPTTGQFWTQVQQRYAVLPGYQFSYAPYASNNTRTGPENLAITDPGYVSNLQVGSQIYLGASNGLAAGVYTLLPARYATLPGAVMITPESGLALGSFVQTDGSTIVGGYRFNGLTGTGQTLVTRFDVAPASVIKTLVDYSDYTGTDFLAQAINLSGSAVPRLPVDAGYVSLSGDNSLVLQGQIQGRGASGGQGALIDISSNADIYITGKGGSGPAGDVILDASLLDSYGAQSLLIGGLRQITSAGINITVNTSNITVDNAGSPLVGPEIMLVATQNLKLDPGAQVIQEGSIPYAGQFTPPAININGNGVMLRVSDSNVPLVRTGVTSSTTPTLSIGAGAEVSGRDVIIDSTAVNTIDPTAKLSGDNFTIDAGRISILEANPGALQSNPGLVLQGSALSGLAGASSLALTGYMSIDLYGTGQLTTGSLTLHTPDLRNPNGGDFVINANSFTLDNAPGNTGSGPVTPAQPLAGSLTVNAGTVVIGQNQVNVDGFANTTLGASQGVLFKNTGGLNIPGNLTVKTPLITAAQLSNQTVTVGGTVDLEPGAAGAKGTVTGGLAASLTLTGTSVTENTDIYLPTGTITLHATGAGGDVAVGGKVDVSGISKQFFDITGYTNGGQINLNSDQGNVTVATGSILDVAAQSGGGNAGTLSVSAPTGQFNVADNTMVGKGGTGGTNGNFVLDVGSLPGNTVAPIDTALDAGGFTQSRNYRVRNGDVTVDNATALNYTLSTDNGSIIVIGKIDASGPQGGSISLIANGSVTLDNGSVLTVAATQGFGANGKGGSVDLEAGSETNGTLVLQAQGVGPQVAILGGSTIDLSVANSVPASSATATANVPVNLPASDFGIDVITTTVNGIITFADGTTAAITAGTPTSVANAVSVTLASNGTVNFAGRSAALGQTTGTLHIRAPQDDTNTDVQVQPINGNIINASQITVEGYVLYNPTAGAIDSVEGAIMANGNTFVGPAGTTTASYTAMLNRLLQGSQFSKYSGITSIEAGAEIVSTSGSSAPLSTTLDSSGTSSITVNNGTAVTFASGTPGNDKVQLNGAGGTITVNGVTTTFTAGTVTTLAAGSVVTFSGSAAGTIKFSSGAGGAIPVSIASGSSVTSSGSTTSTVGGNGAVVQLTSAGSTITIPAGSTISFPAGVPGSGSVPDEVIFNRDVTLTDPYGNVTFVPANTPITGQIPFSGLVPGTIVPGTTVAISGAGPATVTFYNDPSNGAGTSGAIPIGVPGGSTVKTTSGSSVVAAATNDLTLYSTWDLSTFRFGPNSTAGDLTLRSAGNLIFSVLKGDPSTSISQIPASLTDGFGPPDFFDGIWLAPLMPAGSSSWSYRLVAGADMSAADYHKVQPIINLPTGSGTIAVGLGSTALPTTADSERADIIPSFFQTIRTGTGSIDIVAGRDVELLNPLATIYTAGTQAPIMANFDLPRVDNAPQQPDYPTSDALGSGLLNSYNSLNGGNLTITAQGNIGHYILTGTGSAATLVANSSDEMPTNWLYRRGYVGPNGTFGTSTRGDVTSTTWWIDFSNFFEGVGALGGGNVTLTAGNNIDNVDALIPTNARMPYGTPTDAALQEFGGGNLIVTAGNNINGGVYYVERGQGTLFAGNQILTNSTRFAKTTQTTVADELPTTLFLGKGSFNVSAGGNVFIGPVANAFLLPEGIDNSVNYKTYFSTYASTDLVTISSITGDVTIKDSADNGGAGSLAAWYNNLFKTFQNTTSLALIQPWLQINETSVLLPTSLPIAASLLPPNLEMMTFTGDVNLVGSLTLSPSPTGTLTIASAGSVNGLQINGISNGINAWGASTINISDANPANVPTILNPASFAAAQQGLATSGATLSNFALMFTDSGSTTGLFSSIQTKDALHDSNLLHAGDTNPIRIYAASGDVSGITLFAPKVTDVLAGEDVTDVAFYIQNDSNNDISVVSAGRDIILYDPTSPLLQKAQLPGNVIAPNSSAPSAGDIQINGQGTLEVLAGRNLNLGSGPNNADGTGVGITSIGNGRNPFLPFDGASIIGMAGVGGPGDLTGNPDLSFVDFITKNLKSDSAYLSELGIKKSDFDNFTEEQKATVALDVFYLILRDAGRAKTAGTGSYSAGFDAINQLFGSTGAISGSITTGNRSILTQSGGEIDLAAPNGSLTLQTQLGTPTLTPPGIVTQDGGSVNIVTKGDVNLGISRIFTLRGGNIIIWSSEGNIAAGSSPKTVVSAPPTRVLVDAISGDVKTDLAGLATGGGIGVLATVQGVQPGNVDLVAPNGVVDAGDAGIRATGNLNIAATAVLNADNIAVSGTSSGTPAAVPPPAPNIAGLTQANTAGAGTNAEANDVAKRLGPQTNQTEEPDSSISVEVLGYGGGDGSGDSPSADPSTGQ